MFSDQLCIQLRNSWSFHTQGRMPATTGPAVMHSQVVRRRPAYVVTDGQSQVTFSAQKLQAVRLPQISATKTPFHSIISTTVPAPEPEVSLQVSRWRASRAASTDGAGAPCAPLTRISPLVQGKGNLAAQRRAGRAECGNNANRCRFTRLQLLTAEIDHQPPTKPYVIMCDTYFANCRNVRLSNNIYLFLRKKGGGGRERYKYNTDVKKNIKK